MSAVNSSPLQLRDRVVIVTGATRGLGKALSTAFAEQGCQVIGLGRDKEGLAETMALIGQNFSPYVVDVADDVAVSNVVTAVHEKHGKIDILFNNAAVYPKVNFMEDTSEAWMKTLSINIGGVVNCCRAVLPFMIESKFGRIYNIGSWADLGPIANSSAYSVSKGGLHSLTKAISVDIKELDLDIGVHEWIPGHLNTQMSDFTGIDPAVSASWAVEIVKNGGSGRNCIFENNYEWQPPKGIRARIKEWLSSSK